MEQAASNSRGRVGRKAEGRRESAINVVLGLVRTIDILSCRYLWLQYLQYLHYLGTRRQKPGKSMFNSELDKEAPGLSGRGIVIQHRTSLLTWIALFNLSSHNSFQVTMADSSSRQLQDLSADEHSEAGPSNAESDDMDYDPAAEDEGDDLSEGFLQRFLEEEDAEEESGDEGKLDLYSLLAALR